jgi:DNA-binding XRE family transcriptional regulator
MLSTMTNHPNRSKRNPSAARNPKPAEIRAAREAAGLTQAEAAELIYCHVNSWQQWESEDAEAGRRMHPAFWDLWRRKVAERAKPYAGKPEHLDTPRDELPPKY